MENKFLDKIADAFNTPAPEAQTMDAYLDIILPEISQWGEDLGEESFYHNKPWIEITDNLGFHQKVLHFFHEDNEYLKSVNGDVSGGAYRIMERVNKMIIEIDGMSELYDLAFLNNQFFILKKDGPQQQLGNPKYFVMVVENLGKRLEWRQAMEYLYNQQSNRDSNFVIYAFLIVLAIAAFVFFSLQ